MADLQNRSKSWYESLNLGTDEYNEYRERQIMIHDRKKHYQRGLDEYESCASNMIEHVKINGKMICLGTRNEHEKDTFAELLSEKNITVFSQDIAELAKADYTCDFNKLSEHVPHDWDVVFSNSLDHAIDATKTVNDWLKVINSGGILVMGFCFDPRMYDDVCVFSEDGVNAFVNEHPDLEFINCYRSGLWDYWTVKVL